MAFDFTDGYNAGRAFTLITASIFTAKALFAISPIAPWVGREQRLLRLWGLGQLLTVVGFVMSGVAEPTSRVEQIAFVGVALGISTAVTAVLAAAFSLEVEDKVRASRRIARSRVAGSDGHSTIGDEDELGDAFDRDDDEFGDDDGDESGDGDEHVPASQESIEGRHLLVGQLSELDHEAFARDLIDVPYLFLGLAEPHLDDRPWGQQPNVAVAAGRNAADEWEVLGFEIAERADDELWDRFLEALVDHGLAGVELVTSDRHPGLDDAVQRHLGDVGRQWCWLCFTRTIVDLVPPALVEPTAKDLLAITRQPDADAVVAKWNRVRDRLEAEVPRIGPAMDAAMSDVLVFSEFPENDRHVILTATIADQITEMIVADLAESNGDPDEVSQIIAAAVAEFDDRLRADDAE